MQITGSRAIITGAAAGFGRALTEKLAAAGARVAALDIDEQGLRQLQSQLPDILPVTCDVSDNTRVEAAVNEVFQQFGGLEILVNNAGIMKNAPMINMFQRQDRKHPLELWHQVIAVNQNSVFYMSRAVIDHMVSRRNKGVIVNISSISARGNIGQTAYSAAKAAVEAMTRVWAKELGSSGIRAVAVAPGFIDTAGANAAIEARMLQRWIDQTPLRRTGCVDEIIQSILFAIENDFINGETIAVNGGLVL